MPEKNFECQECGQGLSTNTATRALAGTGCPRCGSFDIDVSADYVLSRQSFERWSRNPTKSLRREVATTGGRK